MNTFKGNHYAHSLFLRTLSLFEVLFIFQGSLYFPRLSYFSRFSLNFRNPLLFSEILFLFIQFSLLSHHLFLLLALQLLKGLHSCHETACRLRVVLVLLIALLQDGEELLVVGSLAQGPHDGGTEEQGDEVVEVQTC